MRIAISGAGIAGPAVAHWLRRTGHVPTLIDHSPHLRTGGYVVDFWGIGYRVAQLMGIESAVRAAGYQARTVRGVRPDGSLLASIDVGAFVEAVADRYTTIARSDLSAIIFATIADDVETIFGDSITAIDDRADGVTVSFDQHPAREFDLVLGADGLHSGVRRIAFGQRSPEYYLGCMVAAFTATGYRPRDELSYVLYNTVGAQVGRFALRDDRTLFLFVYRTPAPETPEPVEVAKAALRDRFADGGWECRRILERLDDTDDLYFDSVSQIRQDSWSSGRVALLGDAAAAVSLMAGEGTGLAMLEAYVLAGELHRADGDYRLALPAYEQRLRRFVEGKQRGATKFISFFAAQSRLGLGLRNAGVRALSIRALAKLVSARSFRDDFDLPDYGM
ncbi:FAD-binding domain [Mycobacterium sp. 155]|uniref:FAD-binding domain n=1 Tax=Mycobacterium sp. 155 TaxID=1157943 RepID=UPI00035F219F|nr:FAD-binding domain [Mycobacterium sp. 155]